MEFYFLPVQAARNQGQGVNRLVSPEAFILGLEDGLLHVVSAHGLCVVQHTHPWCLFVCPDFLFLDIKQTGLVGPTLVASF